MVEQKADNQKAESPQGHGSFLDADVLLFALPFAVFIDILDIFLVGVVVSLILGIPLLIWMVWKTGKLEDAKQQAQQVRKTQTQKQVAKKAALRRALKRGIIYFIAGLIPIVSIFFLWTLAVVNTVRGK
jgi:VIT1/CCC1 family predicted Fe2+/Mn2+ transporter